MNRRVLLGSGLAATLLSVNKAFASQRVNSEELFTSELTGAKISWDSSHWTATSGGIVSDGREAFNLEGRTTSLHIQFVPEELVSPDRYAAWHNKDVAVREQITSDDFDDGGWALIRDHSLTAGGHRIAYCEYQLGAFPGFTLQIRFWSKEDEFHENFALAQVIMIAGGPPFLFMEESDVESLDVSMLVSTGTEQPGRTSRSSNKNSSASSSDTSQAESGSRGSDDYVSTIRARRETFIESFEVFYDHLMSIGDIAGDERTSVFKILEGIAKEWQLYPAQASELAAPAGMETLTALYLDWADHIGEMGHLYKQISMGTDMSEEFVEVTTAWQGIDFLLNAELSKHLGSNLPTATGTAHQLPTSTINHSNMFTGTPAQSCIATVSQHLRLRTL